MDLYFEPFDVGAMVDEAVNTVGTLAAKNNNTVEVQCDEATGVMHSDLTKVRQILFNLMSNACKFTKDGSVTLRVARERGLSGEDMVFTVIDTGIVMDNEQLEKVFEVFTQAELATSRAYGGSGLGLSISKRFCEMLGGTITVTSEVDHGSTFTARIPAVAAGISAPAEALPLEQPAEATSSAS